MKTATFLSICLSAVVLMTICQAAPAPPPFADEKADAESVNFNEVGPEENWQVYNQLSKTNSFDNSDPEKTERLMKEIDEFSRLASMASDAATDGPMLEEEGTTVQPDGTDSTTDWFGSTWKKLTGSDDSFNLRFRPRKFGRKREGTDGGAEEETSTDPGNPDRQEEAGSVEDIIKKIANDMKKLYAKIKQAITVMKNWINNARGALNGENEPYTMSASESDGVFVIADPLIGDIDKSNKYTLPINAD